jgi:hypothetical protein
MLGPANQLQVHGLQIVFKWWHVNILDLSLTSLLDQADQLLVASKNCLVVLRPKAVLDLDLLDLLGQADRGLQILIVLLTCRYLGLYLPVMLCPAEHSFTDVMTCRDPWPIVQYITCMAKLIIC